MSSFVLSKLDIDVLMQLAVYGPIGAEFWEPMTDNPDEFGRAIWQQNANAAEPPDNAPAIEGYRFAPLPIGITAEEGLKHCACYGYQTFDEGPADPAGTFLDQLEQRLIEHVAGWKDAPWSWDAADVAARIDRGEAPVVPEPQPVDPLISHVENAFRQANIAIGAVDVSIQNRITARLTTRWEIRLPGTPFPVLDVAVFADERAAGAAFRRRRQSAESSSGMKHEEVARIGRVIVHSLPVPNSPPIDVSAALTLLGRPDETWSRSDPPLVSASGTVLATGVPTSAEAQPLRRHEWVAIGHDELSRQRIADLIEDDIVRTAVLAVDLADNSVVAVISTDLQFNTVENVSVRELLYGHFPDDTYTELRITATELPPPAATIIVTDAPLPSAAEQSHLIERATGQRIGLHPDYPQ